MNETPIYLDYNATTPVAAEVLAAMLPFFCERYGNPSSQHAFGAPAHAAVDAARAQVARLIGVAPAEIEFTSGGTEATNHALKGRALAALREPALTRKQIVISAIEHPATLETALWLQRFGFSVAQVDVDKDGVIDLRGLERLLQVPTLIVSLMHANNETGTIQPIAAAAVLVHRHDALLHVDAAQSAGKIPVDARELGADLLTIAGHKLYAPKGVGALFVRSGVVLEPLIHGAGQESGRRAGTENVPYAVALGAACRLAQELLPTAPARMATLRDRLWAGLMRDLGAVAIRNGHPERGLPNTLNVSFVGLVGAELLAAIPRLAASTGSACHDGRVLISPVLAAMGVDSVIARGAVRFSLGRGSTEADVDTATALVVAHVRQVPASP